MSLEIKQGQNMYYIGIDENNTRAKMTFVPTGEDKIIVDHTSVGDEFRGQGVGDQLLDKVIDYARENQVQVIPLCPFVKARMAKFPEKYGDVLA